MNKDSTTSSGALPSRIIAQAAKKALEPLGVFQMGRSRTWIDDHGWWIVVIEFQPSGFSKGSYLNVAAMWLWHEKDSFTFDFANDDSSRIGSFVEYVDDKQFTPEVIRLAAHAKAEVLRLRRKIVSVHDVARYLSGKASRDDNPWTRLSAAIALGYAGKTLRARWLFKSIERKNPAHDWEYALREKAQHFAEILDRPDDFQGYVKETILRTRKLLKLPGRTQLDIDRGDGPLWHRWNSRFTAMRAMIR